MSDEKTLARLVEKYKVEKDFLMLDNGYQIDSEDCAYAWNRVNQFLYQATPTRLYRIGNRNIVPRIDLLIRKWSNLIPMEEFGYKADLRLRRLQRNYLNLESLLECRHHMDRRNPRHHSTHGISFGTGKKKTPACMVGGTFHWAPGRLLVDFYFRASEVTKTLGADFHFLDKVIFGDEATGIQGAVPQWMSENLASVRIHLDMAFVLAQWFPLFDMIAPGFPLNTEHRFHQMCLDSINLARDVDGYQSKWRAERRIHIHYRKRLSEFKANSEGRIRKGPSFFPIKKKHLPTTPSWVRAS